MGGTCVRQITTPPLELASDVSAEDLIFRKIALRLVPFLFLCYLAAYLDRVNVGFAKLQMQKELGFSETVYGFGAGIFFLGYVLFEVPSNIILHKVGARLWLARVMLTWAIISAATALVSTPITFYTMRFLLGVAEAGFIPGVLLYLTYWFPASRLGNGYSSSRRFHPSYLESSSCSISTTVLKRPTGLIRARSGRWLRSSRASRRK